MRNSAALGIGFCSSSTVSQICSSWLIHEGSILKLLLLHLLLLELHDHCLLLLHLHVEHFLLLLLLLLLLIFVLGVDRLIFRNLLRSILCFKLLDFFTNREVLLLLIDLLILLLLQHHELLLLLKERLKLLFVELIQKLFAQNWHLNKLLADLPLRLGLVSHHVLLWH